MCGQKLLGSTSHKESVSTDKATQQSIMITTLSFFQHTFFSFLNCFFNFHYQPKDPLPHNFGAPKTLHDPLPHYFGAPKTLHGIVFTIIMANPIPYIEYSTHIILILNNISSQQLKNIAAIIKDFAG
ncbi:hypothetical protein Csa_014274 [Cucumis sativus]|nr:hypothetical protein Csa_014274 [Cucumis sativus]